MDYEKLQMEYDHLSIQELDLREVEGLKGLYVDGCIAIDKNIDTSAEKSCILAEELGHHYTSSGNILDLTDVGNRKQEHIARMWAFNKKIGLPGIVKAYEHGCFNLYDTAEFLDVTEEFLEEAVENYKSKYGHHVRVASYIVYFYPNLQVGKVF